MTREEKYDNNLNRLKQQFARADKEICIYKEMLNSLKIFQEHNNISVLVTVRWQEEGGRYGNAGCSIDKGAFHLIKESIIHSINEREKEIDFILGVDGE